MVIVAGGAGNVGPPAYAAWRSMTTSPERGRIAGRTILRPIVWFRQRRLSVDLNAVVRKNCTSRRWIHRCGLSGRHTSVAACTPSKGFLQ